MLAVVSVLLVAGLYTGTINLNTAGVQPNGQPSYSGGNPGQNIAPVAGYPKIRLQLGYINQSNSNASVQAVAQPFNISLAGSSSPLGQGGSAATGIAWSNSTTTPGSSVVAVVGNNVDGGVYVARTSPFTVGPSITTLPIQNLQKIAPLSSVTFSNGTTFGASSVTLGQDAAAGGTYSVTENLKLGNGAYGGSGIEVAYSYNAQLIKSISLTGVPNSKWNDPSGLTLPATTYVPTGYTTVAFQIPEQNAWNSQLSFTVVVTTQSTFNANTPINAFVNDIPFYQTNGGTNVTQETLNSAGSDLAEPYSHVGTQAVNSLALAGAINVYYNR